MLIVSKDVRQRGETLIELLLAFAILSLALVIIMRTMNGGFNNLFVSGQRSQVEASMRGQLSILQAAHQEAVDDPNAAGWANIVSSIGSDKEGAVNGDGCTYTANKNRLYFPTTNATSWTANPSIGTGTTLTTSSVTPEPNGNTLWIEAQHTPKTVYTRGYYDFYIKSCWINAGSVPMQAKMVTRLYDLEETTGSVTYDNLVLTAGPGTNGSGSGQCTNGSNGRITYTIENTNSYPFGDVIVTVTGNPSQTHSLGANSQVTSNTSAGNAAGTYTVRATVANTGSYKEMDVTLQECPPPPVYINGSSHNACVPLYDYEGDERYSGPPGYGFLSNPGPHAYPCRTYPTFGTVYTCVNYDVRYNSGVTKSGSYRLTLTYFDANCGDASNENLFVTGYNYRLEVYRNNIPVGSMYLSPGAPFLNSTYDFPLLNPGDTIGFRWWNNRFIDPGMRDPDLVIRSVELTWR